MSIWSWLFPEPEREREAPICPRCDQPLELGPPGGSLASRWYQPHPPDCAKPKRRKASHVGAPAIFQLELACQQINAAFGGGKVSFGHCYLVGSSLERADWRDVDVRFIIGDDDFAALFPDANVAPGTWEQDPRWLLLTSWCSKWLSEQSGLPVDFQFQPQSHANERHKGVRSALGMRIGKR